MTAGVQSFLKRAGSIKSQLPPATLARLTALEAKEETEEVIERCGLSTKNGKAVLMVSVIVGREN